MKTRQAAYDTAQGIYCKRACGMAPSAAYSTYTGDMDLVAFVETCPVPSTPDLEVHRACWAEMRRMFDEAWDRHQTLVEMGRAA